MILEGQVMISENHNNISEKKQGIAIRNSSKVVFRVFVQMVICSIIVATARGVMVNDASNVDDSFISNTTNVQYQKTGSAYES